MFGLSRQAPAPTDSASTGTQSAEFNHEDTPELWTPEHLTERVPAILDELRERVNAFSDNTWRENLPAQLYPHLRQSIAARDYDGKMPGTIAKPAMLSLARAAVFSPTGMLQKWDTPTTDELTDEQREAARLYRWSVDHADEFNTKVNDAVEAVLADPPRSWEAYLLIQAVAGAERAIQNEKRKADAERFRLSVEECPVCMSSDARLIGPVARRTLVGSTPKFPDPRTPMLRSCLVCWNLANATYMEVMAAETMVAAVGDSTRRQLVATAVRDVLASKTEEVN